MLKKLNAAMDYIEAHLEEDFRLEEVAAGVGISDLSFRQLFYALTGMTLQEYVKNRRLSEASGALLRGCSVTDTAYRYGYQSVDGFTRAFRRWSGLLPSEAARTRQGRTFQRLNFIVTVQGGDTMEYRIVEKPAFRFAGVSRRVPMQFEGVNEAIVRLAESITPGQREELRRLRDIAPEKIVNVSWDSDSGFREERGELTHMIGVLTSHTDIGAGLDSKEMPASLWAVFPCEGAFPAVMQDTMARIYSQWLVTVDYELADSLSFPLPAWMRQSPDRHTVRSGCRCGKSGADRLNHAKNRQTPEGLPVFLFPRERGFMPCGFQGSGSCRPQAAAR